MPKDFMCDRLTENSPLRFLDIDIGNLIHSKYRPSIPYVLQAIFDEGRWRSARRVKLTPLRDGEIYRRTIVDRKDINGNIQNNWNMEWKTFKTNSILFETLNSFWKYSAGNHAGNSPEMRECYSGAKPKIQLEIGDKVMKVDCDTTIKLGKNWGGSSTNATVSICHNEISNLHRRLQQRNHNLFNNSSTNHSGKNSFIVHKLWSINEKKEGEKFSPISEAERQRWKKAVAKRQGVDEIWRIKNTNFGMPPLRPNIYQSKADIMKHIQQEFQMEEKEIKKLNKKYNTAQIVKMYWKDIIDCF